MSGSTAECFCAGGLLCRLRCPDRARVAILWAFLTDRAVAPARLVAELVADPSGRADVRIVGGVVRRGLSAFLVFSTVVALLVGCTTGEAGTPVGTAQPLTITAGYAQEFQAYNNNTAAASATQNQIVLNQVLPNFWDYGPDGQVRPIEVFGSYEKVSDSPLTVHYRINPEAVWSDGNPIDCDDVILLWAARSGRFADAGFQPSTITGYQLQQRPSCQEGGRDFTLVYDQPYADWAAGFGGDASLLPAHIVEQQAQVPDIIAAVDTHDVTALQRAAAFWNTGWSFQPGQLDPALTPSSGPYRLESWQAGQSVTLVANERYWGPPPGAQKVVIRYLSAPDQATALRNGEIQVAAPQVSPDIVDQLRSGGDKVSVHVGDQFNAEQLTFNYSGQFADPQLRRAFALCVPREEILDKLVHPVAPSAVLMQSRFVFPFQPGYQEMAAQITDGSYDRADIAQSRQVLETAGKVGTVVRIGYQTPNQRRADTLALITNSCTQAGFVVQDNSDETYYADGGKLDTGDFDVALFGWFGSALVTGNSDLFHTVDPARDLGGLNKGHYSNPQVDDWLTEVETTTDPARQRALLTQVDKQMWDDLATIPLFALPGIVANRTTITGVQYQPSASGFTWNMNEWRRQE